MAIPFKVYEYGDLDYEGRIWCIRCDDWIPLDEAFGVGAGYDPHIYDHVMAYEALRRIDKDKASSYVLRQRALRGSQ